MISCKLEGGLCNTLFQISATIAHSIKHDLDYRIPTTINNPHYDGQVVYRSPNIKYTDEELDLPVYKEQSFLYSEIPPIDNICLQGYFQSYKYFDDYRNEILKALNFKYDRKKNYCSVHIRIGDYLDKPDHHPIVTQGYLFEAMMNVMTRVQDWEAVKFLVFSDSIRMAKEMLSAKQFQSFPIEYSEGKSEVEDLELASSCDFNIGSNSSFSWWIYYLNQYNKKIGVFPIVWFGKEIENDTKDLLEPECLTL